MHRVKLRKVDVLALRQLNLSLSFQLTDSLWFFCLCFVFLFHGLFFHPEFSSVSSVRIFGFTFEPGEVFCELEYLFVERNGVAHGIDKGSMSGLGLVVLFGNSAGFFFVVYLFPQ